MEQLIQTLLTMTATASVAAVCVMILRLPLKRAPRWITCALWLVVFLRMVCPAGLSLPVSLVPQAISNGASLERVLPPVQQAASSAAPEGAALEADRPDSGEASAPVVHTAIPTETAPVWPAALAGIWAAGGAAALLWAVLSYIRLRRRIADAVLIEKNIYETDQIDTPFVCGLFRPRIYLPVALRGEDRRYVLLHEQAHIRRGDHLAKPLAYLALCVHWFNPILWLSYRLLCRDIETACDQAVIRSFGKEDTVQYAAALLHLGRKTTLPSAVPLAFGEEDAKGRVCSVLSYKKPAFWLVVAAVTACVAAGVLLLADSSQRFKGNDIISGNVWTNHISVNIPTDLRNELIELVAQYDLPEATEPSDLDTQAIWAEGTVTLFPKLQAGEDSDYTFLYTQDSLALLVDHYDGGGMFTPRKYPMPPACHAAYAAWHEKLDTYLWTTRPDTLFANRGREIQDEDELSALLAELNFSLVSGGYSLQLDRSSQPYHLTIALEQPPILRDQEETLSTYLRCTETVLFSLLGNIDTITWAAKDAHGTVFFYSTATGPGLDEPEAFRLAYQQMQQTGGDYLGLPPSAAHTTGQVLYTAPQVPADDLARASYDIRSYCFSPNPALGNGTEEHYGDPYYLPSQNLTSANDFLAAYGVDPAQHQGQATCTVVQNDRAQDTGYRIYEWDSDVFLAHFDLTGGGETLEYLVQLET